MNLKELTSSEQILLGSVVLGSLILTGTLILCIIWKRCWIYKYLWKDEKASSSPRKKSGMDDIICIRYPPDIYPTAIGVYRENILRSPEDELARLFRGSPIKRDSTYSSMSDGSGSAGTGGCGGHASSSTYELATSPPVTNMMSPNNLNIKGGPHNNLSPTTTYTTSPSISPDSATNSISPLLIQTRPQPNAKHHDSPSPPIHGTTPHSYLHPRSVNNNISPPPQTATNGKLNPMTQQFNEHQLHLIHDNNRQPFFTFALKFEEENGLIHIDFIEARNLPPREYLNVPSDVFFTIEIQPKRHVVQGASTTSSSLSSATISLASALAGTRTFGKSFTNKSSQKQQQQQREMNSSTKNEPINPNHSMIPPHYRFVTKTLKKVLQTCDFSETFLAQLSRTHMKDYFIRFTAFDQDRFGNPTELGSTTLTFDDFHDFTQHKLVLSCSLKEPIIKLGEILVGLCHLPTAERVSVSIIKVTNLNPYLSHGLITKQSICYVRVLLLRADTGKILKRKKTTYQRCLGNSSSDQQPQFNETLVFDMPPAELLHSVLLVLVCITNKIPSGGSHGCSPTGTLMPPLSSSVAPKRHSTPEANMYAPFPQPSSSSHSQRHSIGEALFHFSDNLNNKAKESTTTSTKMVNNETKEQYSPPSPSSTLTYTKDSCKDRVVGKVALGYTIRNAKGKIHWEQMVRNPRNVTTDWHTLK